MLKTTNYGANALNLGRRSLSSPSVCTTTESQQVSHTQATAQAEVSHRIQQEIVEHITKQSAQGQPIRELHETLLTLEKERLITHKELIMLCRNLCSRII